MGARRSQATCNLRGNADGELFALRRRTVARDGRSDHERTCFDVTHRLGDLGCDRRDCACTAARRHCLGRFGLRVRDGSARVYWSNAETNIPRVMEETFSGGVPGGKPGFSASSTVWIDHTYLGDGWWYQPREAVQAVVNGETATLGRIPRNGITWHSTIPNTFKPNFKRPWSLVPTNKVNSFLNWKCARRRS